MPVLDGTPVLTLSLDGVSGQQSLNGKTTTGLNRLGVLCVAGGANDESWTVSSVTWGGVPMTRAVRAMSTTIAIGAELWYLVNPPTAASNIVFTTTQSNTSGGAVVASFEDVDQIMPFRAIAATGHSTHGSTPLGSVASDSADLVLMAYGIWPQTAGVGASLPGFTRLGFGNSTNTQGGLASASGASPEKSFNAGYTKSDWALAFGSLRSPQSLIIVDVTDGVDRLFINAQPDILTTGELFGPDPEEYGEDFVMVIDTTLRAWDPFVYIAGANPNVTIYWGDGQQNTYTTIGSKSHSYAVPGQYEVRITGYVERIGQSGEGLYHTLQIKSIGTGLGLTNLTRTFENMPTGSTVPEVVIPADMTDTDPFLNAFYDSRVNHPINWDLSPYVSLHRMFYFAREFNQPINHWEVAHVTNMSFMFGDSIIFNQPLNTWNVVNVLSMQSMFSYSAFNQDLGMWSLRVAGVDMTNMLSNSGMSPENYARTLIGWSNGVEANSGPINVTFGAANVEYGDTYVPGGTYFDAQGARNYLVSQGWTITDAGWQQVAAVGQSSECLRTFDTTLGDGTNTISVSIGENVAKNITVYWGDGFSDTYVTGWSASHTYAAPGTYLTRMRGTGISSIRNSTGPKFVDCHSYGLGLGITSLRSLFSGAAFNSSLAEWDVSNITNLENTFGNGSQFNQPLNAWNVGNVTNMYNIFGYNDVFDQPLDLWNTSNVGNMGYAFAYSPFNHPIGNWNVSALVDAAFMFEGCQFFNQPLNGWVFSNALTTLRSMFSSTAVFNQPLNLWSVSSVSNMNSMFNSATAFDQDLGMWSLRVAEVTMSSMLNNCGMSVENYSRTLIGWSNSVSANGGPFNVTLGAVSKTYNSTAYSGSGNITDDFNRPDAATLGDNWVPLTVNEHSIEGNTAVATGSSSAFHASQLPSDDHFVRFTVLSAPNGGASVGVCLRGSSLGFTDSWLGYLVRVTGNNMSMFEKTGLTTYVSIGSITVPPLTAGDVLEGEIVGSTLIGKINGVPYLTVENSGISSGKFVGRRINSLTVTMYYDDFEAGVTAAAARTYLTTATGSGGAGWTITDGGQV